MAHCMEDLGDLTYDPRTLVSRAYYWICRSGLRQWEPAQWWHESAAGMGWAVIGQDALEEELIAPDDVVEVGPRLVPPGEEEAAAKQGKLEF